MNSKEILMDNLVLLHVDQDDDRLESIEESNRSTSYSNSNNFPLTNLLSLNDCNQFHKTNSMVVLNSMLEDESEEGEMWEVNYWNNHSFWVQSTIETFEMVQNCFFREYSMTIIIIKMKNETCLNAYSNDCWYLFLVMICENEKNI